MAEAAKSRAPVNEAAFREACAAAGVSCDWSATEDDPIRVLLEQMHCADLVLVAQAPPEILGELSGNLLPDYLPIAGDGPVLVVPHGVRDTPLCRRVLIAWKPCREAGRALRDALPLFHGAETIGVLTIGNSEGNHTSGDKIAARLKRLGIQGERIRNYDGDSRAGSVILAQSKAWAADMIVMGAFGHSRLREFVLGGATRDLLRRTPVTVLMSH
jgi:nucleotide-binding universal stress UspA family protein